MAILRLKAERPVAAPADVVYRCIADYKNHHAHFLPPQFSQYKVVEGGYGAGTVVEFTSNLGGQTRKFRAKIEEPMPGKVLVERDTLSELVTTFTVLPEGSGCRVSFETVWQSTRGFAGILEGLFAPALMRKMYQDELTRLEQYAQKQL